MTEYIRIKYLGISKPFDRRFLQGLVDVVSTGCITAGLSTGADVRFNRRTLVSIAEDLYNGGQGNTVFFYVKNLYEFGIRAKPEGRNCMIVINVPHHFVSDSDIGVKVCLDLYNRSKSVYNYTRPEFAVGDWEEFVGEMTTNYGKRIFWLNFYGHDIVERVGLGRFRTVPYGHIEELDDGGVLLIRGEHPNDNTEPERIEAIRRHLFGESIVGKFMRYLGR